MGEIDLQIDEIGRVTVSAPRRRNALTPAMAAELAGALERGDSDPCVAFGAGSAHSNAAHERGAPAAVFGRPVPSRRSCRTHKTMIGRRGDRGRGP